MSVLDIDSLEFDEPVTRDWLLSKGFREYDATDYRKAFPEIEYVYWWKSRIEVSIQNRYVRSKIVNQHYGTTNNPDGTTTVDYRPTLTICSELGPKSQIINLMECYRNECI